jgi:hypothetical protein
MQACLPDNEEERPEALRRYSIFDTLPERDFDDLALLAAQVCRRPRALASLGDAERQWFRAKVGLAATGTAREIAFSQKEIGQRRNSYGNDERHGASPNAA